jgi:hypothetical protein
VWSATPPPLTPAKRVQRGRRTRHAGARALPKLGHYPAFGLVYRPSLFYFAGEIMPIVFPDFKNAHLFWLTVCGEFSLKEQELLKWMKGQKAQFCTYATERGICHVRLAFEEESGNYVHFDLFAPHPDFKKIADNAKAIHTKRLQESTSRFLGKPFDSTAQAGFKVKLDELPETGIIRSMLFQTKMGNVAIKLNGANFLIRGAPIQTISWREPEGDDIFVTLASDSIKTTFSDDYLTSASKTMEQAFNVFVLGKG